MNSTENDKIREAVVEAAEQIAADGGFMALDLVSVAAKANVTPEVVHAYFENRGDLAFEIAMNVFKRVRTQTISNGGTVDEMLDAYLTNSMRVIVGSGLALGQRWVTEIVEDDGGRGKTKLQWDWGVIAEILKLGIERGELVPETPIARLVGLLMADFYGTLFSWVVAQGAVDATRYMHVYCTEIFPKFLEPYKTEEAVSVH